MQFFSKLAKLVRVGGFLRVFARIAVALEQIAASQVYFASVDAKEHNRFFNPNFKPNRLRRDESELMHSDPATEQRLRDEDAELILQGGYPAIEQRYREAGPWD